MVSCQGEQRKKKKRIRKKTNENIDDAAHQPDGAHE
jgi:hypothetical protein